MKIAIIGVGTTAMTVTDIIFENHNFELAGFVGTMEEESLLRRSKIYNDIPFLGSRSILKKLKDENISGFIVAIGDNSLREKAFYEGLQAGLIPINAVSVNAIINSNVTFGKGIVVSPGVILSHGVSIEDNIILETSVVVGINTKISSHSCIHPGVIVSGECKLRKNVTIQAGCIITIDHSW